MTELKTGIDYTLTEEEINKIIESKFNIEHVKQGIQGVSSFVMNNLFRIQKNGHVSSLTDITGEEIINSARVLVGDHILEDLTSKIIPQIKRKANRICSENFMEALDEENPLSIGITEIHEDTDNTGFLRNIFKIYFEHYKPT